ncbi:hypothetical protein SLE2022_326310 [Rubroshorea leprosula]
MGRSPCCDENGLKKGPWTPEEDEKLVQHIQKHGHGSWRALPKLAGLNRCGKSCRLRWTNYLRPDIKRGKFSADEEQTILHLHSILGNKWSAIATHLPGRTDNEIKNFWNTHLKKRLIQMGIDPMTHQPRTDIFACLPQLIALANLRDLVEMNHFHLDEPAVRFQTESVQLANKLQYLQQCLSQTATSMGNINVNSNSPTDVEALNLLNSWVPNSVLTSTETMEINPFGNEDATPQPLHHPSLLDQPQVPFNFQTSLNGDRMDHCSRFTDHQQIDSTSPWVLPVPPTVTETSISNPAGASTTSSYNGSTSPNWLDLYFDHPILQEI